MRRILILTVVCFGLFPGRPAKAVEDIAPEEIGTNRCVSGEVSLAYSTKSGNTEKNETDLSGKVKYDSSRQFLAFVQGTFEKTTSSDVVTEDEALLHARVLHKLRSETLYAEAFGQYQNDVFKGIENRGLVGGGGRWRYMYDPDIGKLYLGLGAFAERIDYTQDYSAVDESNSRMNSYLAYTRKLTETAEVSLIGYYQPAFGDRSDYYTSATAELTIRVVSNLHLRIGYEYERDSTPPEGVKKVDDETKVALLWKF